MRYGVGNRVSHCFISNAPHQGIFVEGNNHIIEFNEISFLALETGDVGAIYSGRDWSYRGNVVRYNYFHDLNGPGRLGAVGVYMDDLASGFKVFGNIFYNCDKAVQIGGGRDNIIVNNIFLDCNISVKIDNRGVGARSALVAKGGKWRMYEKLNDVNYTSDIYQKSYPELVGFEQNEPLVPKGNNVSYNVSVSKNFIQIKPNDKDYWMKLLEFKGNIINPEVFSNSELSEKINSLNKTGKNQNSNFEIILLNKIGMKK